MRLHGRHYVCKILKTLGEVLLYEQIYRMTAGGDDDISLILVYHSFIFVFNDSSAYRGLLNVKEAEFFKCAAHRVNAYSVVICNEGGCKADYNGVARLKKNSHFLYTVCNFLCILWALYNAVTAENTLVSYDVCLVSGKSYRLYGTLSYATEAGLAV